MATLIAQHALDMDDFPMLGGVADAESGSTRTFEDGIRKQDYVGTFTYGTGGLTGGTIQSTSYYESTVLQYALTGLSLNAVSAFQTIMLGQSQMFLQAALAGNDVITGSSQADVLKGYDGNDEINGGAGADVLDGQAGTDTLYGGNGNDVYWVDSVTDKVIEGARLPFEAVVASALPGDSQSRVGGSLASISGDGRYVAFTARSEDLVVPDPNGRTHLFLKDLQTGALTPVDTIVPPALGHLGGVSAAKVSGDGSAVGFQSFDGALVNPQAFGWNVYVRTMSEPNVERVSQVGGAPSDGNFFQDISADGRYVVFVSMDSLITGPAGDGTSTDVVLGDTLTGALTVVSYNGAAPTIFGISENGGATLSPDGRFVAFRSTTMNLVVGDTNLVGDVFLRDMLEPNPAAAITRVSTSSTGLQANAASNCVDVSQGGRYVLFDSTASNLVGGDTNGKSDVFLKDTYTGQTTRVSTGTTGTQGNDNSTGLAISADGHYALFQSYATNLVPGDTDGLQNLFVKDLTTGELAGLLLHLGARQGALSDDGRFIVVETFVSLVSSDLGPSQDVYRLTNPLYVQPSDGTDEVRASVTYRLPAEVENLTLIGARTIDGFGNDLANILTGNSGNNTLDGDAGADQMVGGDGDDFYVVDQAGDTIVELSNGGFDTVMSSVSRTIDAGVERLVLSGAATTATGNTGENTLGGNAGDNTLDGGRGGDTLAGGLGNDGYRVDNPLDLITEGLGQGDDGVTTSVSYALANNVENLTLSQSAGNASGTGNAGNNVLEGNSRANVLDGGAGNDILRGLGGEDVLIGGAGDDRLFGGAGRDTLYGDAGADRFVFDAAINGVVNLDLIVDFVRGADRIELASAIFGGLGPAGTLAADRFVGGAGATAQDALDRIVHDSATGMLYYDADGSGAQGMLAFAQVTPGLALVATDFVVAS